MKYDVVIVGGGAAGSVLASRLAENPNTSILVLEAGNDYPDPNNIPDEIKFGGTRFAESPDSEHNWALRATITEEQGEIHVAQGKVIGGGSSINGQAMQRGLPEDFESWASMGNDEWSYTKVLPFFRKSEHDLDIRDDFHGTDGPMPVRRRQMGDWPDIQKAFRSACLKSGFSVIAGSGVALKNLTPKSRIYGVEPEFFNDTQKSISAGSRQKIDIKNTSICDALMVETPGELTFPINQQQINEIFTVDDNDVIAAMKYAYHELGIILEPSGAVGLALILKGRFTPSGKNVVVVFSGGNIDASEHQRLIK